MLLDREKVYVIAELSANHNQDFEIAAATIKAMKQAGADAVKLQTFTPESMTLDSDLSWFQTRKDSIWSGQKLYDLYSKAHTPWEWHPRLQKIAQELGLDFFSSPFDFDAVDKLESINVPAYKIASLEITDIPLIQKVAKTGKPVIVSTGVADEGDINLAVETIRNEGNNNIALLKCTSAYPTPYSDLHLNAIPLLSEKFNVITGLSDHSMGIAVPVAAVAKGARIIEKHFILEKSIPSVDRDFSLDPSEFKSMVDAVRQAEMALGMAKLSLTDKQLKARESVRSLFIVQDLKEGDILTKNNLRALRPGKGLHPKFYYQILGKKLKRKVKRGTPLDLEMVE